MGWIADLLKEIPSAARYKAEAEQLSSDNAALEARNESLTSQLEAAQREIQRLATPASQKSHSDCPKEQQGILQILATVDSMVDTDLEKRLGIGHQLFEYHVGELLQADIIFTEATYDNHSHWELTHRGRAYLSERGLIQ